MGRGGIFCADIVIGSPMFHSARIGMTGHCAGPIIFASGLAGSQALRRSSLLGLRGCITGLRLQSAVLNDEIQAEVEQESVNDRQRSRIWPPMSNFTHDSCLHESFI